MKTILIGIGGLDATKEADCSIKTMALGSCVGIIMLDPTIRAVGMAHVALPSSDIDKERSKHLPGYFADSAVPALLKKMSELGSNPVGKGFFIKITGGANVMDPSNTFNIGKRNILAIKKELWKLNLGVIAEDIGGDISRTVEVFVNSGLIRITSPNKTPWEI